MSNALLTLLSGGAFVGILGGGIAGLWKYFTSGRSQIKVDQITALQKSSWEEVRNLRDTVDRERVERKKDKVRFEKTLARLESGLVQEVAPMIEWIDAGAPNPPGPPHITQGLRDMIAAIRYQQGDADGG